LSRHLALTVAVTATTFCDFGKQVTIIMNRLPAGDTGLFTQSIKIDAIAGMDRVRGDSYPLGMKILPLELDDCFAVRQAARHISRLYERHLSDAGLTPTQFSILCILSREPSLTMIQLAEAMVMERTTLVRALKPLLRDRLVCDAPEVQGKRRLRLTISAHGRERLEVASVHWQIAQASFERSYGPQAAAHLRGELFRITSDVSHLECEDGLTHR
jgi:DNA-binding MarR family transcriptional regulator